MPESTRTNLARRNFYYPSLVHHLGALDKHFGSGLG